MKISEIGSKIPFYKNLSDDNKRLTREIAIAATLIGGSTILGSVFIPFAGALAGFSIGLSAYLTLKGIEAARGLFVLAGNSISAAFTYAQTLPRKGRNVLGLVTFVGLGMTLGSLLPIHLIAGLAIGTYTGLFAHANFAYEKDNFTKGKTAVKNSISSVTNIFDNAIGNTPLDTMYRVFIGNEANDINESVTTIQSECKNLFKNK